MENNSQELCNVVSDLMVLYTIEKGSEETKQLVETHLKECQACAQAFRLEPQVKNRLQLPSKPIPNQFDTWQDRLKEYIFPGVGILLHGLSRLIANLEGIIHKIGISTIPVKTRLYRARRRVSGGINQSNAATDPLIVKG